MNLGDLFLTNPTTLQLLNNGVAFVKDVVTPEELKTLRFELKTFVCEGEYSKGLEKILRTYIANLDRPEQAAVWVSGFYGSGKSHLGKILRYLWTDFVRLDCRPDNCFTHSRIGGFGQHPRVLAAIFGLVFWL